MLAIRDSGPTGERFPLGQLLESVGLEFEFDDTTILQLTRLGGHGARVWELESTLDRGSNLMLSFPDLVRLADSGADSIDELRAIHGQVAFGVFDASFMFVQSPNRAAERRVATRFMRVKDCPDLVLE